MLDATHFLFLIYYFYFMNIDWYFACMDIYVRVL